MDMINEETGERAPGDLAGTDDGGEDFFRVPEGCIPVEPYWLDADGYAHEGAPPTVRDLEDEAACRGDWLHDSARDDALTGDGILLWGSDPDVPRGFW